MSVALAGEQILPQPDISPVMSVISYSGKHHANGAVSVQGH